jgi:hypothetical protein
MAKITCLPCPCSVLVTLPKKARIMVYLQDDLLLYRNFEKTHFDLVVRNRVKEELKKEQAGLESLQASNLWRETF